MNDDASQSGNAFLPLVLLAVSVLILLGWQWSTASLRQDELRTEMAALQKSITREDGAIANLDSAVQRQQTTVTQSQQVQLGLAKLATDLLEAAKTDSTAKAIADKFGIKQNAPAAGAAATPGL